MAVPQPQQSLKQLRVYVNNYYSKFGPDACNTIINRIVSHGDVGKLLVAMGMADPEHFEDRHLALRNFLRHYGIEGMEDALAKGSTEGIPPLSARKKSPFTPGNSSPKQSDSLKNLMGLGRKAMEARRARENQDTDAHPVHDSATVMDESRSDAKAPQKTSTPQTPAPEPQTVPDMKGGVFKSLFGKKK